LIYTGFQLGDQPLCEVTRPFRIISGISLKATRT